MPYEKQVPFTGDARRALETGREVFIHHGFQVSAIENSSFEARRSGMHSSKQDPIVGVSVAMVTVVGGVISVRAELANVWRLIRLLALGFLAMGIGFVILFGLLFGWKHGLMSLLWLAPWPIVFPLAGLQMRKHAEKTLDMLMANMAAVASDK